MTDGGGDGSAMSDGQHSIEVAREIAAARAVMEALEERLPALEQSLKDSLDERTKNTRRGVTLALIGVMLTSILVVVVWRENRDDANRARQTAVEACERGNTGREEVADSVVAGIDEALASILGSTRMTEEQQQALRDRVAVNVKAKQAKLRTDADCEAALRRR